MKCKNKRWGQLLYELPLRLSIKVIKEIAASLTLLATSVMSVSEYQASS